MNRKRISHAIFTIGLILLFANAVFAAQIQYLPNLVDLNANFLSLPNTICGGPSKAELIAKPDISIHFPITGIGENIYYGLSGANGDLGNGDDYVVLHLGGESNNETYWLDSIILYFNDGIKPEWEGAYSIVATAGLEFAANNTYDDLSKALGLTDGSAVGLKKGTIVFFFCFNFATPVTCTRARYAMATLHSIFSHCSISTKKKRTTRIGIIAGEMGGENRGQENRGQISILDSIFVINRLYLIRE